MASTFNIYTEITHMMEHNLEQQQVIPTKVLMNAIVTYSFMLTHKKIKRKNKKKKLLRRFLKLLY